MLNPKIACVLQGLALRRQNSQARPLKSLTLESRIHGIWIPADLAVHKGPPTWALTQCDNPERVFEELESFDCTLVYGDWHATARCYDNMANRIGSLLYTMQSLKVLKLAHQFGGMSRLGIVLKYMSDIHLPRLVSLGLQITCPALDLQALFERHAATLEHLSLIYCLLDPAPAPGSWSLVGKLPDILQLESVHLEYLVEDVGPGTHACKRWLPSWRDERKPSQYAEIVQYILHKGAFPAGGIVEEPDPQRPEYGSDEVSEDEDDYSQSSFDSDSVLP